MKKEQKIFIDKRDSLESVVHSIINISAEKVILNIPRNSSLGSSVNNLQIIKRESESSGKELFIESVDDHVLGLAGLAKIPAKNPIFGDGGRVVADIMPVGVGDKKEFREKQKEKIIKDDFDKEDEEDEEEEEESEDYEEEGVKENEEEEEEEEEEERMKKTKKNKENLSKEGSFYTEEEKRKKWWRIPVALALVFVFTFIFYGLVFKWLPKAEVTVSLEKVNVLIEESVVISPSFEGIVKRDDGSIAVAGEVLTATRNSGNALFPASGRETINSKAKGELIVVNAFSSASQVLVANTRFLSPEGKLFRLDRQVTIPGAEVIGGNVEPSQIRVSVTADEAGEEYNVGPSIRWRIPGFEGTPRYDGFYANAPGPMTGGFIGEASIPTEEDVDQAIKEVENSLEASLRSQMNILLSDSFKLFEEAQDFEVLDYRVIDDLEGDSFTLFMEGRLRYLVFDREALDGFLADQAKLNLDEGMRLESHEFSYEEVEVNWINQEIRFKVTGEMAFIRDAFMEEFEKEILGKKEDELRQIVFVLPGIENASISLWPFWVKRVPNNPDRVEVIMN